MQVCFLQQMCSHCSYQSQRGLRFKQHCEGQHTQLSGMVPLQEKTQGDVLDLKARMFVFLLCSDVKCKLVL